MLRYAKSRFTGKRKNIFFFLIILVIVSSALYGQRIFRPMDPDNPYTRYGKSPYSGPPFFYFGSTSYNYKISSSLYNSYLSYVDAGFTSWNNSGPVQFSRTTSGLTLTAEAQDYGNWGPAWSYPSWNDSTYELTPSSGSIVLNSSSNCEWRHDRQDLNASPHVIDVQTMVVHEAGHIMGLAHPLTDSYTHDATAPTMAGGDNAYFDNTLECRSLENEDIYGTQILQLRVPTLYSDLQTALDRAEEIGVGYVKIVSNYSLSGNITVLSGITLTIDSGAMVNYNGHTLRSSGGTITIESGGIITLNSATYVDITGTGSTTYEVNGINVGTTFNGIGQSIEANPPSGYGVAGWSDGVGGNYRTINSDVTVNAKLKALHKSNATTAWDNTSQRKLIQTLAGGNTWLHQVYTSAGHVWIEHSGDGGSTWTLGNNGLPLDGAAGGKCPSITYATHDQGYAIDNYIGVVWQEQYGTQYKIKGKTFSQYGNLNSAPFPYYEVTTLFTEPSDAYSSVNANPNLVMAQGYTSPYLVTFERKSSSGSLQPGINWLVGHTEDSGQRFLGPFGLPEEQGIITGTNASTTNVQLSIWPNTNYLDVNLVQQAGATGAIYSHWISLYESGGNWNYYQLDDGMISYPSANKSPAIASLPNGLYSACWIEVQNMAFYYLGNPSVIFYYGNYGTSCSINRGGGTSSSGFAVWSQQPSSGTKYNKSIRFDNGLPVSSTIQTLSTNGRYVQVGNGATSDHSYMYVSSFYPNTLPYYFCTSATLAPLSKNSSDLVEGRGVLINTGDASFRYCLEGLNVDGKNIPFIETLDTMDYSTIDNLNNALLTEPFQIDADSRILFTEISGFADSALACKALGQGGYIRYKVELIEDASGKVLGTVKNVNLNASNIHTKKTPTYAIDAKGYAKKTVRVKVTFETNLVNTESEKLASNANTPPHIPDEIGTRRLNAKVPNIILMKSYAEENVSLAKSTVTQLELEAPDIPAVYALKNCYPNPFNPKTKISFDLPEEARVEIIVYDLMGHEVWKSARTHYSAGTYSIVWNGVNHSGQPVGTGIYLVRLNSAKYNATQKILLMK